MNKIQEIIQAAYRIFGQKGYDGASMREICGATHLTTAGLYHYVKSKEELFNMVEEYIFKDFLSLFREQEKNPMEKDPRKFMEKLVRDYVEIIFIHKNVVFIIMEKAITHGEGEFAAVAKSRRLEFVTKLREALTTAKKSGMVDKDINITVVTFILIAIVNWISLWYNPKGRIKKEELISSLSKFFIKGFFKNR